jgi:hypothetical protein
MRLTIRLLVLAFLVAVSSCASNKSSKPANYGDVPGPSPATPLPDQPIVKPSAVLTGKVVSFNAVGRFTVLSFPLTRMPGIDQTLFLYRSGLKVGEVRVTGPQKDENIVADLVNGEAKIGDEVRDR